MTIQEYTKKYGTRGLAVLVGEFIRRAPEFKGGEELAKEIGTHMGDLVTALEDVAFDAGVAQANVDLDLEEQSK